MLRRRPVLLPMPALTCSWLPRYVSFQIPRTFALLRGSLGGLLGYRPGLRAGCLLAVPDQTAEELTKRSYAPTDARGFERLEVIVATLNRNDRPGIAPGRQHQIHEKPAHPTVSVHVGMDIDEHKVPEYGTNACIGLCSQRLDKLGHRVAHGFGFRWHVLGTADVDLAGADRKSTRLNSSHMSSSYAVFCLKKK